MTGDGLFMFTVAFSLVSGTAACLLALLTWEMLRRSPMGMAVFVLTAALAIFIVYHVIVLVHQTDPTITEIIKSAVYTGATGFVWTMVLMEWRLQASIGDEVVDS